MSSDLAKVIPLTRDESNFLRGVKTEAEAAHVTNFSENNSVVPAETVGIGPTLSESISTRARMLRAIETPRALELAAHHDQLVEKPEKQINLLTDKPMPLRKHLVLVLVQFIIACFLIGSIIYFAAEIKAWFDFD
jgi:hypothetical protein